MAHAVSMAGAAVEEARALATTRRFRLRMRIALWGFAALSSLAVGLMALVPEATPYALYAIYAAPSNTPIPLYNEPGLLLFAPGSIAWLLALVAMPGVALGAVLDYALVGRALDSPKLDRLREHRFSRWVVTVFGRAPAVTIFFFALLPAPFWLVRVLAPASHYPLARYIGAVLPGRFARYVFVASVGAVLGLPPEVGLVILGLALLYLVWALGRMGVRLWLHWRRGVRVATDPVEGDDLWFLEQAVLEHTEQSAEVDR